MHKKEILFVNHRLFPFTVKLAKELQKNGYTVNSVSFYEPEKAKKISFDNTFSFLKKDFMYKDENIKGKIYKTILMLHKIPKLYFFLKQRKHKIIIGVSGLNWFITFLYFFINKEKCTRFYFPYDVTYLRNKNIKKTPIYERFSEQYNFKNCDGIIHKGPKNILSYLPKNYEASSKESLQFLPYCDENSLLPIDKEYFNRKISNIDNNLHLVYVGGVYHHDPNHYPTISIFKDIVKQNLHLHVYPVNYQTLCNDLEYKVLQKNKYFHLHKPIYGQEFQKELSKYDWGIFIFNFNFNKIKKEWAITSFGNKISSYLEAGLPSICNTEQEFAAKIITKNKFGVVISKTEDIKKTIHKYQYEKLIENLDESRRNFTLNKNIKKLIKFIESVK